MKREIRNKSNLSPIAIEIPTGFPYNSPLFE